MSGYDLKDYVDVAERVQQFYAKHPEGRIWSEVIELTPERVVVRSFVAQTPDDPRPCSGMSMMNIPGVTNFTRGSEVENTETSAVGRAIAMAGFAVKGGIASRQEVMNKQGGPEPDRRPQPVAQPGGVVTIAGTVTRGTGNGMDLAMRQTPDGSAIGFKAQEVEGLPSGKRSIGVRAFNAAALAIAAHADTLVGQRLTISGTLRGESFKKDGKDVAYDVLVLETADGPDFTFPADVPAAAPSGVSVAPARPDDEFSDLPW